MAFKSHPVTLFIDRNGFDVHQDTLAKFLKVSFTPDVVASSDVISKEKLIALIATLIQANKITPSSIVVVLSDNIVYVKDLPKPAVSEKTPPEKPKEKENSDGDKQQESEVQDFLSDVPFENVMAKVIKTANANRVVAANKDLILEIVNAFVKKGFTLEVVIPGFMYGRNVNFTAGLDSNNIKAISENTEALKFSNMLTDQAEFHSSKLLIDGAMNPPANSETSPIDGLRKNKNLRQYILIGALAVLLIILAVVYLFSRSSEKPVSKAKANPSAGTAVAPSPSPASGPTLTPASNASSSADLDASSSADLEGIEITIENYQEDGKVALLKKELLQIGLQNVAGVSLETSAPGKSSVVISQDISVNARVKILNAIGKVLPNPTVLEDQNTSYAIKILIGKS